MKLFIFLLIVASQLINNSIKAESDLYITGVSQPVINLDGNWEITLMKR